MIRKTVPVELVKDVLNAETLRSETLEMSLRIANALQQILIQNGSYKGFMWVDLKGNCAKGIENHKDHEGTRRHYF